MSGFGFADIQPFYNKSSFTNQLHKCRICYIVPVSYLSTGIFL